MMRGFPLVVLSCVFSGCVATVDGEPVSEVSAAALTEGDLAGLVRCDVTPKLGTATCKSPKGYWDGYRITAEQSPGVTVTFDAKATWDGAKLLLNGPFPTGFQSWDLALGTGFMVKTDPIVRKPPTGLWWVRSISSTGVFRWY